MPITHQISSNPKVAIVSGGDIISQLQGLIGQATGLIGGSGGLGGGSGVGLPGIQSIGSQIASISGSISTAGGSAGVDTSAVSSMVSSLGSQLSSVTSMAGASSILSSLTGQLSNLKNLLNPSGGLSSVIHSHILDKTMGIVHSAFQGQHKVSLGSGGIDISSAVKVAHTAPTLPHNGLTTVSDALQVTKGIFGQSFSMLSDRRLKRKIKNYENVLSKVMALRLKTFEIQSMDWEKEEPLPEYQSSFGLIAQEVQEVFPEVVKEGKYLTIEESKVSLLLLAAFQEFVIEVRQELAEMKK